MSYTSGNQKNISSELHVSGIDCRLNKKGKAIQTYFILIIYNFFLLKHVIKRMALV